METFSHEDTTSVSKGFRKDVFQRTKTEAKATADPSTAQVAKNASNSAQDDSQLIYFKLLRTLNPIP
jgi:hypothetical protein